ncbi:hypothetical protein Tco_1278029, partial [Tanacetum coccineum]
ARQENPRESFDELTDTPFDFSAFMMNRLNVETLTPKLLAGPTFELMKGTCKSLVEIEYFFEKVYKETTEQLNWHNPKGQQYPHDLRRIIAVTKLQIVEWHGYKHLDWITIQRDDDKLHTFKEDNFKRLRLQDIEDVLLLLVQGKLTNLNVENVWLLVSLSECSQEVLSDLKQKEAYSAYSNPRGFIYHNRDKKNKLMGVDELHKFSDRILNDVPIALDDRLKRIRMEYLPQTIWRQSDREREKAMIQAIDKQLKSRRIIRSLERFVGGRPYEEHAEFDEFDTHVLERFNTSAGNPVKEILLKLNLPDHRILKDGGEVKEFQRSFCHSDTERLSRSDEVLKLKNFKKDATLKLFKSTNQERCSRSHSRQAKEQAQDLKSMISTSNHKLMIEVKDYELKTKIEALWLSSNLQFIVVSEFEISCLTRIRNLLQYTNWQFSIRTRIGIFPLGHELAVFL